MKIINEKFLKQNIESCMERDLSESKIGCAAVSVKQGGRTVYENTFGTHSPDSSKPLETDAIYRMASMTKPITAAAILIQAGRGLLSLNDPIEKFLPEFSKLRIERLENGRPCPLGYAKENVKIFNLLTHTSGIGTGEISDYYTSKMTSEDKQSLDSAVKYYSSMPIAFEPGSTQFYSPVAAFDILAKTVELTSGTDFESFLKKEIFDPLGMKDTTFCPNREQWKRTVGMHNRADGKSTVGYMPEGCVFADFPTTYFCGGAGLVSTLHDYSSFAQMLLDNDGSVVKKELIDGMKAPQLTPNVMPGSQAWGYGVRVIANEEYGILPKGAFGWSGAYGTHFWVDPENKITAVYMKNSHYDGGAGSVTSIEFEKAVNASL